LKHKKKIKYFFFRLFPLFWAVLIAVLSLLPESEVDKVWFDFFIPIDKIAHFVLYAVLSFSSLIVLKLLNFKKLSWSFVVIWAVIFYGIVIEFLQELNMIGRHASLGDVLADVAGVLAGVLLYLFIRNSKILSFNY